MLTIEKLKAFLEAEGEKLEELPKDKAYLLTLDTAELSPEDYVQFATSVKALLMRVGITDLVIQMAEEGKSLLTFTERSEKK